MTFLQCHHLLLVGLMPAAGHAKRLLLTKGGDGFGCPQTRVCVPEGVKKGEELLAAYIKPEAPRDLRRSHLLERYGFDCACPRCLSGK